MSIVMLDAAERELVGVITGEEDDDPSLHPAASTAEAKSPAAARRRFAGHADTRRSPLDPE